MSVNSVPANDVLPYVLDNLSKDQICTSQSQTEFELIHSLDSLSSLQADALGLPGVTALHMHVKLPSAIYYGGEHQPTVEIQLYDFGAKCPGPPYAAILSQITRICQAFFADHWPCQTQLETLEFLPNLYKHIQARIPLLGCLCVVCGCKKEQIGLKPLPCNSKACNIAFDEDGIGADLRDIYIRPALADLLISMASAACQCTNRRDYLFQGMPNNPFPRIQGHRFRCVWKLFSTHVSQVSQQIDWQRSQYLLQSIPTVALMAKEFNLQDFFISMYPQTGLTRLQLLRWVLNSCQGHLMQLQGEDEFPTMATRYQFRLCTDRPSKEAAFSQLKEKYGSQFLFHGSPFYNWHSILEGGLKNMSNTTLMSNGSSYGPGIYLAENSELAARHCDYKNESAMSASANSTFGKKPYCLALCEVINQSFNSETNAPGASQRVVPDADRVVIRYLFVYKTSDSHCYANRKIPHIQASTSSDVCEKHAQRQAVILDAVRKAFQDL